HGQAGSRVRTARAGCNTADADASRGSRIAIRHEYRGLVVPDENMLYLRMFVQGIVNCCGMRTWNPEDDLNTASGKTFDEKLSPCHPHGLRRKFRVFNHTTTIRNHPSRSVSAPTNLNGRFVDFAFVAVITSPPNFSSHCRFARGGPRGYGPNRFQRH